MFYIGGTGMYLVGRGCIWWDGDENKGFGDKPRIKQVGRLFFLSLSYTNLKAKIGLKTSQVGRWDGIWTSPNLMMT